MSDENVEVVRQALAAYARGDIEEGLSYLHPEGELHSAVIGSAEGKVFRGHDGIRTWFAELGETFEEMTTELTEYRDLGDRVVAFGHIHARGRESGLELRLAHRVGDDAAGWESAEGRRVPESSRNPRGRRAGEVAHSDRDRLHVART
jgi:ketosteroid isomerase-like protein